MQVNKRILIIDNCNDCPFFDNEYYGYHEVCKKLNRVITRSKSDSAFDPASYPIPYDCPLEKCVD